MKPFYKIVLCVLAITLAASLSFVSVLAQVPEITSTAAILTDAESGNVLFEKNPDQQLAPASTTKIMTLLLAAEYGKMDEQIVVDYSLFSSLPSDATIVYYQQDEVTTVEAAFMATYLTSANDAAILLANHIGGSVENFVSMMNNRAKELGCTATNFTNPTGLYDEEHYTTVKDMALMTKAILENKTAQELMKTLTYTLPAGPMRPDAFEMTVGNALMNKESSSYYPSVVFGKTGYTDGSKFTIVAVAKKDNTTLISVAFQTEEKLNMYSDVKQMFDHGFGDFYKLTLTKAELENLFSGKRGESITVENDIKLTIPSSVKRDTLAKSVESSNGEAYISVKGDGYDFSQKIADIQTKSGAGGFFAGIFSGIWWFIKLVFKIVIFLVVLVVVLYLILAIYVNVRKNIRRKKRYQSKNIKGR